MKGKIKVLHFAKLVSRNDFVDSVVSNLNPDIFEVYVITFEDTSLTFSPVFKEKGIPHINLGQPNARNLARLVPAINKIIRKKAINILHSHLFEEAIIGGVLKVLNPQVKFILGRHYSDETYLLHHGIKRKFWLAVEGFANQKANIIIAGSLMVKQILERQKVRPEKIAHIPYGFDFGDYRYHKNRPEQGNAIKEKYNVGIGDLLLVNVGRLFHLKGQDLLIEVFAELNKFYPNLKLLIIGDGPDRKKLEEKVFALQLEDKIIFTGWLKDAHTYISAADIVVHPTLSEMFSQLMIESMALGKPLMINDVSAVRDVISHMQTGIICSHKKEDWKKHLEILINDQKLRDAIGAAAEYHVKDTYPIHKVIGQYEQLYLNLTTK
jgi:glycosyltransferase involved in cell wall biosynthesis